MIEANNSFVQLTANKIRTWALPVSVSTAVFDIHSTSDAANGTLEPKYAPLAYSGVP